MKVRPYICQAAQVICCDYQLQMETIQFQAFHFQLHVSFVSGEGFCRCLVELFEGGLHFSLAGILSFQWMHLHFQMQAFFLQVQHHRTGSLLK